MIVFCSIFKRRAKNFCMVIFMFSTPK